jgi:hypothetical protein
MLHTRLGLERPGACPSVASRPRLPLLSFSNREGSTSRRKERDPNQENSLKGGPSGEQDEGGWSGRTWRSDVVSRMGSIEVEGLDEGEKELSERFGIVEVLRDVSKIQRSSGML